MYDHVLGADPDRPGGWTGPYTYRHAFHEPFVLFSFMAAVTRAIEFATGIIILPQRQAALVAKQAATLDLLSGGRLSDADGWPVPGARIELPGSRRPAAMSDESGRWSVSLVVGSLAGLGATPFRAEFRPSLRDWRFSTAAGLPAVAVEAREHQERSTPIPGGHEGQGRVRDPRDRSRRTLLHRPPSEVRLSVRR